MVPAQSDRFRHSTPSPNFASTIASLILSHKGQTGVIFGSSDVCLCMAMDFQVRESTIAKTRFRDNLMVSPAAHSMFNPIRKDEELFMVEM
jgi:hypothetical protein